MRQLSCILDSCMISASYEVSQAQKAILLMPRTAKGASTSSEELTLRFHHAQMKSIIFHTMKTIGKSIRVPVLSPILETIQRHRLGIVPINMHHPRAKSCYSSDDDWKSTTERTLSVPCGLTWPSSRLTLALVSLIVSPFFSTTLVAIRLCRCLLRSDYM